MSLKPIELQIALPRTQDAGTMQQKLVHKPIHDQELLAVRTMKEQEELRKKSQKVEASDKMMIEDEKEDSAGQQDDEEQKSSKEKQSQVKEASIAHPYKGHHIDLSL